MYTADKLYLYYVVLLLSTYSLLRLGIFTVGNYSFGIGWLLLLYIQIVSSDWNYGYKKIGIYCCTINFIIMEKNKLYLI